MKKTLPEIKIERDFNRPWGGFIKFIDNKPCTVKILQIKKGESLSLQFHKLRREFWYLISGKAKITIGKSLKEIKQVTLMEGECIFIPKRYLHRAKALKSLKMLEISEGIFKENDVVRIEDEYGRA